MPSTNSVSVRPGARRRDGGFSFVEVIVTIALVGIVALAFLESVQTSIKASSTSRSAAQVETTIVNAADRVNRAPKDCNYLRFAQAAVLTQGWPASTVSVTHQYYVPGPTAAATGSWATGSNAGFPGCPGTSPDDLLVQRVSITVTSPDGNVRRTIQVVKSDV